MQLHKLEDFENVFEFEKPFWLESEQDLYSVVRDSVSTFMHSGVNDFKNLLRALYAHLSHEALVILKHLNGKLFWLAATLCFEFSHAELHAGKSIGCYCVLHLRRPTQVGSLGPSRLVHLTRT